MSRLAQSSVSLRSGDSISAGTLAQRLGSSTASQRASSDDVHSGKTFAPPIGASDGGRAGGGFGADLLAADVAVVAVHVVLAQQAQQDDGEGVADGAHDGTCIKLGMETSTTLPQRHLNTSCWFPANHEVKCARTGSSGATSLQVRRGKAGCLCANGVRSAVDEMCTHRQV